jgi:mRNA interferase MazF
MQKSDIVLVRFPFTDLSGSKLRPALILKVIGEDVLMMFITSNLLSNTGFDVLLKPSKQNGLKQDSILKLGKIVTLSRSLVYGRLGHLSKIAHDKVIALLTNYLLKD